MLNSQNTMIEYLFYSKLFDQSNTRDEYKLEYVSHAIAKNLQYNEGYYKRFALYTLPRGANSSRPDPKDAPQNITLTHTEDGKYLLVQKLFQELILNTSNPLSHAPSVKTKKPYMSIRMLVGFPPTFSLKNAVILAKSAIWDDLTDQKTRSPQALSLKGLEDRYIKNLLEVHPSSRNTQLTKRDISFIIQSYLAQRFFIEQQSSKKPRILLIVPSDTVTDLLNMLSRYIPSQLTQGTTFSTYESDIQYQEYDICGTFLLQEEQKNYERYLKPSTYKNDFVLNTYAPNPSIDKPADLPSELWGKMLSYANHVSEAFAEDSSSKALRIFLKNMEQSREHELSVATFLEAYQGRFHITPQRISLNTSVKTGANSTQRDPASATGQGQEQNRYPKNPAQDPQVPTSSATSYTTEAVPPNAFQQSPVPFNTIDDPIPPAPSMGPRPIETFSHAPFQQAPVAPDKVKYPLQQTPELAKEIPPEPIQDLAQDMSRPASSLSADVLPVTFSSEEDGDASSQKSIQEYLNNSGSLATLEESSSKMLSREEILEELYDPRRAEKLLENVNKHKYMIELMLNDPAWTQNYVSPALKRLHEIPSTGKPRKLSSAINKLIHHIHAIAIQAMRENNQIRFQECLFILPFISPYLEDRNLWRTFLYNLSQEQKYATFLQISWSYRERLLGIALKVLESEKDSDDKIVQPLLAVNREDFGELISMSSSHASFKMLRLPKRWSFLATKAFLSPISVNDPAITRNIRYFDIHEEILDNLFKDFISLQEPHMWNTIISFFKILVENNYKYQKKILLELLEANTPQPRKIELTKLVQNDLLLSEEVSIFKINDSLYIEQFLSNPLFREITLDGLPNLPLTWERMNALYLMLEKVPPKKAETVVESLANILNNCIDSPIRLGMLFSSFTRQNNATTLSLLLSMAQKSKEEMTQTINDAIASDNESTVQRIQSRFSTYVQFALQLDTSYQGSIKGHDMLSRLLHGADERIFSFLTNEAKYWLPELHQAWYKQKDNYPSSSQPLEIEDTPITANNPTADPSILYATIESELSPEQRDMLAHEENKLIRRMEKVLKRRKARKLARFWQENYIALQKIKGESNNRDMLDALEILERAYNYSFAIKNADRIAEGSEKKREAERAIVLAHTAISSYNDDLRFTRKERKRFNLARERTEQTQNTHDPTKDTMPHA